MKYILRIFVPFVILGFIVACEENDKVESRVVTEDILFIGSNKIRMSGRVLTIAVGGIQDHGFFVATDEEFTSPIIISLGERSVPGRFIGETEGLVLKSDYFIKSFISSKGNMIYGNTVPFTTLAPIIKDFSPKIGVTGQVLTITGSNFTEATEVFVGGSKAVISNIEFESIIKIRVPNITTSSLVDIMVIQGSEVLTFSTPFEYIVGNWEIVGTFINERSYFQSFFFQSDSKLVFGLGNSRGPGGTLKNSMVWELDFNSLSWSELPSTGATVASAFAAEGFYGSGSKSTFFGGFVPSTEFWKFNASTGSFDQLETLPFAFSKSVGSLMGNELYLFGGNPPNLSDNFNYFKFDTNGQWGLLGEAPIKISQDYPNFQFDNSMFFIEAGGGLYRYAPQGDNWTRVSNYPETVSLGGMGVVLNNKAYIGLFDNQKRIWEYDIALNSWKRKNPYPDNVRPINAAWWSYNNMIYILRSDISPGGAVMNIWSFDPEGF